MDTDLSSLAGTLRGLHRPGDPLLLPNAWDVTSSRALDATGFPVVATTSGGVAASLGYPDGERIPAEEMFAAVGRIARAVDVPVIADIEAGFGLGPIELVQRLLAAGAVGCNLEDSDHGARGSLVGAEQQAERLAAVKAAGLDAGVDLVVNARVDVFLGAGEPPAHRLDEAVRRARLYVAAGADCVFPIGLADEQTVAAFVAGVDRPVNILWRAGSPALRRLA